MNSTANGVSTVPSLTPKRQTEMFFNDLKKAKATCTSLVSLTYKIFTTRSMNTSKRRSRIVQIGEIKGYAYVE